MAACELVRAAWRDLEVMADARTGQPSDPVQYLACAVLEQAAHEYRCGRYRCVGGDSQPLPSAVRAELRAVFASRLWAWWCDAAGVDADYVRKRIE